MSFESDAFQIDAFQLATSLLLHEDERTHYRQQLRLSHHVYFRASLHDHNEDFIRWIDHPILGGQVDVDTKRVPERSLSLELFDPRGKFGGHVFADNFIRMEYGVRVDSLDKLVWHPVFFGPITKITPADGVTTVEGLSKEVLLQEPVVWGRFIRSTGLGGNSIRTWVLQEAEHNRHEIQGIESIAPIRGGTWRVVLGKDRTDPLDWDIGAGALETAIEGLGPVGSGNVSVTGGPLNAKPFKVEWIGAHANDSAGEMEIQDNTLSFDDDIRYAGKFLRRLLRETGESRFHFANFGGKRLPKNFKLPKEPESVWSVAQRVVRAVNQHSRVRWRLFYDGAGVVRVEHMDHGWTFDERTILNTPTTEYSLDGFRNTVIVEVNRGNEARPIPPEEVHLQKRNPMSPHKLRRNGKRRYIVERVDNPHIRTPRQARKVAKAHLHELKNTRTEVTFDAMPIPILVPGSRCKVVLDGETRKFTVDRYTLPLTAETPMSVGYLRRAFTKGKRSLRAF